MVGRPVGQPGQQRQPAERDECQPGQREGGRRPPPDRSRAIPWPDARPPNSRAVPISRPRPRHQGQIAACPGDAREPGLPAPAEPGRIGGRSVQRRPGHHHDAQHQHGESRQPGQRDDAVTRIAAQAQAGQAAQHAGQVGADEHAARPAGAEQRRLGQHGPHHLRAGGAARPQQRGLLLTQAGQQPGGQQQPRPRHHQQQQCGDREQRPGQHDGAGDAVQALRQARGHVQPLGQEHGELRDGRFGPHVERLEVPAGQRRGLRQYHPRGLAHAERPAERSRVHHGGAEADGGLRSAVTEEAGGGALHADARDGQQVKRPVHPRPGSWPGTGR